MLKIILSATTLAVLVVSPLSAATLADLSPTALPGKTLALTFEGGDSSTPLTGTWTATFEKTPANGITIRDFPGPSASSTTTWTYIGATFPDSHAYTLTSSAAFGNKPAELTLWVSEPGIRFYLTIDGVSNYGGVVFQSSNSPEISVQQPAGRNLTDAKTKKSFGIVPIAQSSTKTFTIKNTGKAKLTELAITKNGTHKRDFIVENLSKNQLAPGASTTFKITFKPTAQGIRKAVVHISSNDADENPFDIPITGEGVLP